MKTETTMFFEHVLRENRPVSDFLNANYTFLNERLATHYGIEGVTGSEFRRVPLKHRSPGRRVESGAPSSRCRAIRRAPRRSSAASTSCRTSSACRRHRRPPTCRCSRNLPAPSRSRCGSSSKCTAPTRPAPRAIATWIPLGFGLENYDAIGRWRDTDGEFPGGCERDAARRPAVHDGRGDAGPPAATIAPVLAYV